MGLFDLFKRNEEYTVDIISTKREQKEIELLAADHIPLVVSADLTDNGNLLFRVGRDPWHNAGKLPPKITDMILSKYTVKNGVACDITIGQNYKIEKGKIVAKITIVPLKK